MKNFKKSLKLNSTKKKSSYSSGSGHPLKLNQSFSDRLKASKHERAIKKATRLSAMPKNRFKRFFYRLHPKRMAEFWFSREGAVMALKILGVGIVVIFLLTIGVFAYFRKDLPKIKDISGDKLGGSITYYDRTGKTVLWQDYNAVKRLPVDGDQISKYMQQATVAIEDKDFYNHGAFDMRGIIRAGTHDVFGGSGVVQGGSTITQQLVKLNEQWTNNRTITRKVKELILAVELEREYSKKDILTGYLNIAPYGGIEYGVESAARDYFHTTAKDLTLAQSAMLAAIPQSPSYYSPYSSPEYNSSVVADSFGKEALLNRQHYILDQMVKQKMITKKQADDAKKVDILAQIHPLSPKFQGIESPYFVLAAKQALEQKYGPETVQRGGWQVTTTLDLNLQHKAEQLVQDNLPNAMRLTGGAADEAAIVAEDVPTGQIVALVGGTDFSNPDYGQNNYAAGILIPPGSSFKPYDYATFINNNNAGAGSVLYDSEGPLPGYPCTIKGLAPPKGQSNCLKDYDNLTPGPITLRYALGGSRNIPAVKAMLSAVPNDTSNGYTTSINKVIDTASAMMDNPNVKRTYNCYADEALTQTTQCYGASAIGDGAFLHLDDHVNGLSTISRLGKAIPHAYILSITDSGGKNIYKWTQPKGNQVIKADAAYIVDDMAADPNASYLPGYCNQTNCSGYKFHRYNGWHFAIKTGTTNNGFDGLMTSWSTKYAVVTWVGNHQRNVNLSAARGTAMEYLTEPLAKGFMQYAHTGLAPKNWDKPDGIKLLPAFIVRNKIHYGDVEPSPTNDIYPSWYQPKSASTGTQTIDKVSKKLATDCTPVTARETVGNANANTFSVDKFVDGAYKAQTTATDDVHKCGDVLPTISVFVPTICSNTDNDGKGCDISATVTAGTFPLNSTDFPGTVSISVNGQQVQSFNVSASPSTVRVNYKPTATGSVSVTATVTDSALYQSTSTASMNTTLTTVPPPSGGGDDDDGGGGGGTPVTTNYRRGNIHLPTSHGNNRFANYVRP